MADAVALNVREPTSAPHVFRPCFCTDYVGSVRSRVSSSRARYYASLELVLRTLRVNNMWNVRERVYRTVSSTSLLSLSCTCTQSTAVLSRSRYTVARSPYCYCTVRLLYRETEYCKTLNCKYRLMYPTPVSATVVLYIYTFDRQQSTRTTTTPNVSFQHSASP